MSRQRLGRGSSKLLPVKVAEEDIDAFREECDAIGRTVSEQVRRLIRRWTQKQQRLRHLKGECR